MLLDVLMRLRTMNPSLSFRRACVEGICGSDPTNITGKNGLACVTNMRALPNKAVLKPLPCWPIIRDLMVETTQFFKQPHSVKPSSSVSLPTVCTNGPCAPAVPSAFPS